MKFQTLAKATVIACQSISIITFALFPSTVFAQTRPDSKGNYYFWAGSWIVVDSGNLNCRSGPGTNYSVLTRYPRASTLLTFSELEGNPIRRDRQGLPWARIKWAGTSGSPCFVRANISFVRPIDSFSSEQLVCIKTALRRGNSFYDAAFNCVD